MRKFRLLGAIFPLGFGYLEEDPGIQHTPLSLAWLYVDVDVVVPPGLWWCLWSQGVCSHSDLEGSIPGVPGADYPTLSSPPATSFSCSGKVSGGYYADREAGCQGEHYCHITRPWRPIIWTLL